MEKEEKPNRHLTLTTKIRDGKPGSIEIFAGEYGKINTITHTVPLGINAEEAGLDLSVVTPVEAMRLIANLLLTQATKLERKTAAANK